MKTKHILTALALPAMFAACTADDIVSVDNGLKQAQRPLLSEDFTLTVNGEAESRYAVEGSTVLDFVWSDGDKIGANLIDVYAGGANFDPKDPTTWTITQTVAPALPFVNEGGVWKSAGELGVGNYLFTNPYNPADKNRAAAKYELPIVVQYDHENPNAHIEKYNKAVAHVVLKEGDTQAKVDLMNIFTYPKIVVNFPATAAVTKVTKVIMKKANGFITLGALNHNAIVDMGRPATIETWLDDAANEGKTEEDYWKSRPTSEFVIDGDEIDANKQYATVATTEYFVYEMDAPVSNRKFEVRLMLPSIDNLLSATLSDGDADVENDEIWVYLVTNDGNYKFELTNDESYAWNNGTVASKKKTAFARNKSNTLTVNTLATAQETEFEGLNFSNLVSNADDWNTLVAKYGDLEKYSAEYIASADGVAENAQPLKVKIVNSDFALTSELEMPSVAEFVIESDVKVEGEVTLKNIKVQGADVKVTVEEGAVLTTSQTFIAPEVCVEKGGELVFAAAYDKEEKLVAYDKVTKVCNHGTVTVPAAVIAQFDLNNAKDAVLNVGAAASRAAEVAVANIYGTNDGIINNNGEINVVAKVGDVEKTFVNNAPTTDAGYKYDTKALAWDGVPTINNEGVFNAKGTTTNSGMFVNNKELSSNFTGESIFYNTTYSQSNAYTALLKVGENAKTYIDANTDEDGENAGKIVLAKATPSNFVIHKAKEVEDYNNDYFGTIEFTLNDKDNNELSLKNSPVNYLITNVGINLTNTYTYEDEEGDDQVVALPTLIVNGGEVKIAKTTGTGDDTVEAAKVTDLYVKSGDVLIGGTINSVTNVYVCPDATLGIPASAELSVSKMENIKLQSKTTVEDAKANGKLMINGILNLSTEEGDANGNYDGTLSDDISLHKNAKITCKADTDDSATVTALKKNDAKVAALQIVVDAYLNNYTVLKDRQYNLTWATIKANDVAWAIAGDNDFSKEAWAKKAVSEFLTSWNTYVVTSTETKLTTAADVKSTIEANGALINDATYEGYDANETGNKKNKPGCMAAAKASAMTATAMQAGIKAAMGNTWIGTTVYKMEFEGQAITEVIGGTNGLMNDYTTAIKSMIEGTGYTNEFAKLSIPQYLAWKDKIANVGVTSTKEEDKFPKNVQTAAYIDSASYIEFWKGSDLYNDLKLWNDLSYKYYGNDNILTSSTGFVAYNENNINKENMYKSFVAVYRKASETGVDALFAADDLVESIDQEKLSEIESLKFTPEQMKAMLVGGTFTELAVKTGN